MDIAPKKLNAPITGNVPVFYADEDLTLEQGFVGVCV
jgi:hypothetical protein